MKIRHNIPKTKHIIKKKNYLNSFVGFTSLLTEHFDQCCNRPGESVHGAFFNIKKGEGGGGGWLSTKEMLFEITEGCR